MAIHKHLPIYRDAQRLVTELHDTTRKAPRDLRYTLVQRLLDEAVELCVDIADENMRTANSYLGTASHADTWRLRGAWCRQAERAGLVASADRTKASLPEEKPC